MHFFFAFLYCLLLTTELRHANIHTHIYTHIFIYIHILYVYFVYFNNTTTFSLAWTRDNGVPIARIIRWRRRPPFLSPSKGKRAFAILGFVIILIESGFNAQYIFKTLSGRRTRGTPPVDGQCRHCTGRSREHGLKSANPYAFVRVSGSQTRYDTHEIVDR